MKRVCLYLVVIITAFFLILPQQGFAQVEIVGETGIVFQVESGRILYNKDAHKVMYPASTTKVWTAVLALEQGALDDVVTISRNAAHTTGSRVYLNEGEQYTLEELLHALMLASANDAAIAIAEHVSGSVEGFSDLMNARAGEIGVLNTNFRNPNGLPDPDHYSTAYDLALMTQHALQYPAFQEVVATQATTISYPKEEGVRRPLHNGNRLLRNYPGGDGVKTGYTIAAGQCLVGSATRDGQQIVAVVLRSQGQNLWTDITSLLDYGFANYRLKNIVPQGELIVEVPVKYGEPVGAILEEGFDYSLLGDGSEQVESTIEWANVELVAPVQQGEVLGKMVFTLHEEQIGFVNLIAERDVQRKIQTYWWFRTIGIVVAVLVLLAIRGAIRRRRRRLARMRYYRKRYR